MKRLLRFYLGMQLGLAIAAGLSVAGLAAALRAVPLAATALTLIGAAYLAWLAWSIATAPVGSPTASGAVASAWGGFLLGAANPKVYLALVSLFASFRLVAAGGATAEYHDALLKWALCIGVTAVVDLGWLGVGVGLGRVALSPRAERVLNVVMGGTIVLAAAAALR
ncbi:MAG TPA: LysE family transporter [Gemmatimonadales bacterium]|nr:LysE family transporter [Gemmatimonadales bacterium]